MILATWNVLSLHRPGALARLVKKIFEEKLGGRRGKGRPRWENLTQMD
jgi:hypothetical protein